MSNLTVFRLVYAPLMLSVFWTVGFILPQFLIDAYSCVAHTLLAILLVYNSYFLVKKQYWKDRISPDRKAVLITGCDTGFGHELAKRLDFIGFKVFATCLFPEGDGAKRLRESCSNLLHVVRLDVTNEDSVRQAFEYVKNNLETSEFWAVVNNAGIMEGIDLPCTPLKSFERCLDVNSLGPVRVTKAFLPLLKESRGRVVVISSISGRFAAPLLTPYTMSKFAASAFTECLRMDLIPWGVKVINIQPEAFKTHMTDTKTMKKLMEELVQGLDEDVKSEYGEEYFKNLIKFFNTILSTVSDKPHKVVEAIENAVSLEQPDDVYMPCRNAVASGLLKILFSLPPNVKWMAMRFSCYLFGIPIPKEADGAL